MTRGKGLFICGIGVAMIASLWGLERGSRLMLASHLRVQKVEVQGCHRIDHQKVLEAASIPSQTPILKLDLKEISQRVEVLPWVRSCKVRRVLPDTVSLNVEERRPVALINLKKLYYVDEDGTPFTEVSPGDALDYPILTGWEDHVREECSGRELIREALWFLGEVQNSPYLSHEGVSEIHLNEFDELTVFTTKRGTMIALCRGDLKLTLRRLEEVWKRIVQGHLPVKYIVCEGPDRIVVGLEERG